MTFPESLAHKTDGSGTATNSPIARSGERQSTKFIRLATDAVVVVKSERIRQDLGDKQSLESLAHDMKIHGMICPIAVDEKNRLISGERRLEAWKLNGESVIEGKIQDYSGLPEEEAKQLAREVQHSENAHKKQFTPEEAAAYFEKIKNKKAPFAAAGRPRKDAEGKKGPNCHPFAGKSRVTWYPISRVSALGRYQKSTWWSQPLMQIRLLSLSEKK